MPRLERAIGVIYRPQTERESHYFQARVADQFDAIIHHLDNPRALEPLERTVQWDEAEVPETYPFRCEKLADRPCASNSGPTRRMAVVASG